MKNESVSRRWNTAALLAVALLAAVPQQYLPLPPQSAAGFVFSGTLALIIVGFWLRMLIECLIGTRANRRSLWAVLFFAVPIFSAFIYFATTRSLMSEKALHEAGSS
jgi:phosphotransferase system  glucose/maltose/N-acetylglucosamine-specific IIC component